MSTVQGSWRRPDIVNSGITMYLDAGVSNSYPRIGATNIWKDVSGLANNSTLVNGPIFDDQNGGSIVFDGTNDFGSVSQQSLLTTPTFTICCYVNPLRFSVTNDSNGVVIFTRENARLNLGIYYGGVKGAYFFVRGNNYPLAQLNGVQQNFNFQIGTWYYIAYVVDIPGNNYKMFVNNTMIWSSTIVLGTNFESPGINPGGTPMAIAARYGGTGGVNSNLKLGSFIFYNRALSNQEIIQNFNATRFRFGI